MARGQQQWTWRLAHGTVPRLDYIGVSACCAKAVVAAWVCDSIPIAVEAAVDHAPVVAELRLRAGDHSPAASSKFYSRAALRTVEVQERVAELWAGVPPFPPSWSVEAMPSLFSRCARLVLAEACSPVPGSSTLRVALGRR